MLLEKNQLPKRIGMKKHSDMGRFMVDIGVEHVIGKIVEAVTQIHGVGRIDLGGGQDIG
ncbi:hypothetical protein D3C83_222750 [compost metagenome]